MKRSHGLLSAVLTAMAVIAVAVGAPSPAHAQAVAALDPLDPAIDAPNIAGADNAPWNRGISQQMRADARAVFLEGNRLFKIPLFSQAVEKYNAAIEKWQHPAFFFNLAIAEINLGQYLEAREHLERAMQYGPDPLRSDRFVEAKKQLVEVERHLGRLRIRVPTASAEISVDGVPVFSGPVDREIWVSARTHEIAVKKPEYVAQSRRLAIAAGTQATVNISLLKLVEDRPFALWKPWAVIGAGALIGVAAGGLQAIAARNFTRYDEGFNKLDCAQQGCMQGEIDKKNPKLTPRLNRARLEQNIAVGGYIAGGAAIATGIILLYLDRPHLMQREDPTPNAAGVAVVPVLSTDMVGVQLTVNR